MGNNSTPIKIPALTTTVNTLPYDASLYGLGPAFDYFDYGSQVEPPPPPPAPPTPPVPGTPGAGGGVGGPTSGGGLPDGYGGGVGGGGNHAGGAAGDYAGHPGGFGADLYGRSVADVSRALLDPGDPGYFTMPRWLNDATSIAAKVLPWQFSLPISLGREAGTLYNTYVGDQARQEQNVKPLSFMQWLGSALQTNPYGDLTNPLVANRDDLRQGALSMTDPRTGASLYSNAPDKAETLTGDEANYGPFGIFGSSGPALSYRQANLTMNPNLAPRVALPTGQNFAESLGYSFDPRTQAYRNLAYNADGDIGSFLGTPVSVGGINAATGQTEYTPREAALRQQALHLPSVNAPASAADPGRLTKGDKLYDSSGHEIGHLMSDGTARYDAGYGPNSGGSLGFDSRGAPVSDQGVVGSWGHDMTGYNQGVGGSDIGGGYADPTAGEHSGYMAEGGRVESPRRRTGRRLGERDYGWSYDEPHVAESSWWDDPIWVRHGNDEEYAGGGRVDHPVTYTTSHVRGPRAGRVLYFPDDHRLVEYGDPTDSPGRPDTSPGMGHRTTFARGGVVDRARAILGDEPDELPRPPQGRLRRPRVSPADTVLGADPLAGYGPTVDLSPAEYGEPTSTQPIPPLTVPTVTRSAGPAPGAAPTAADAVDQLQSTAGASPAPQDVGPYAARVRALESGTDDAAVSPTGAGGRYQFLESTWNDLAKRYPNLGLGPWKDSFRDAKQQDLALNQLTADNVATLKKRYGIGEPTDADRYVAHLLGAAGGGQLLTAVRRDPSAPVTRYVSPTAAAANRAVFYGPTGPLTVKQAYDRIATAVARGRWS